MSDSTGPKSYKFVHRTSLTMIQDQLYVRQFLFSKMGDQAAISQVETDFNLCMQIKSQFIVNFQGYKEKQDHVALVRPFIQGHSLLSYIKKHGALKLTLVLNTAAQIAIAIQEMHKNNLPLKALLAQNIIILSDGHIKVVDVGIEAVKNDSIGCTSSPAALLFLGPEGATGNYSSTLPLDIWNFGILIYLMVTGEFPFVDSNLPKMMKNIKAGNFSINEEAVADDKLRSLLSRMLVADPEKRIKIDEAKFEIDTYRKIVKQSSSFAASNISFVKPRNSSEIKTSVTQRSPPIAIIKEAEPSKFALMPKTRKINSFNGVLKK